MPQSYQAPNLARRPLTHPYSRPAELPLMQQRYPWRQSKEKRMTLCAAAIASDAYIVAISDTMVQGATISSDGCSIKMEPFARDWLAMISGDDITQGMPIIQLAEKYFANRANTVATARTAFKRAYQKHLSDMASDAILSRYGLDMKTFLASGKRKLTEKVFASICEELKTVRVGCEFLIFGFDGPGKAHIFSVVEPGVDHTYDKPGFCCIGSGGYAAEAMLYFFGQATVKTLPETVFNMCAAKFMAERSGIGRDTFLYVKQPRSVASSHRAGLIDDIRTAWEAAGVPRVPPGILGQIERGDIRTLGSELT
jgi:hypothetical protein